MELKDIYDINRQKKNKTISKSEPCAENEYVLAVHLCLFNSKGQMLIQQRAASKKHWPNLWDVSLSGGVQAGEDSQAGITREVKEEFGIDIDFSKERAYFTINNDGYHQGFNDYYIIEKDIDLKDIHFQDGEVQSVKWATKEEILKMIKNGQFLQYYPSFIETIFDMKQKRGTLQPSFGF